MARFLSPDAASGSRTWGGGRKEVNLIKELNPYWSNLTSLWTEDSRPPQTLRPDRNRDSGSIGKKPAHHVNYCKPESPISSCLDPSNAPSSTRAIVVSLTDAVNHPIKLTKPSLGVVS